MRQYLPLAVIALACASPAAALDVPPRKVGLWEMKTTFEGGNIPPQTAQHCIDADTDKLMNATGASMAKDMCSKQDVQQAGSTIVIDSVCKFGPMTTTSHAVVSGDFNSAYTVKISSESQGAPAVQGMPAGGAANLTVEAKWLGACKADQKPGDMVMAGGQKVNIRDLQNMPGMPGGAKKK